MTPNVPTLFIVSEAAEADDATVSAATALDLARNYPVIAMSRIQLELRNVANAASEELKAEFVKPDRRWTEADRQKLDRLEDAGVLEFMTKVVEDTIAASHALVLEVGAAPGLGEKLLDDLAKHAKRQGIAVERWCWNPADAGASRVNVRVTMNGKIDRLWTGPYDLATFAPSLPTLLKAHKLPAVPTRLLLSDLLLLFRRRGRFLRFGPPYRELVVAIESGAPAPLASIPGTSSTVWGDKGLLYREQPGRVLELTEVLPVVRPVDGVDQTPPWELERGMRTGGDGPMFDTPAEADRLRVVGNAIRELAVKRR